MRIIKVLLLLIVTLGVRFSACAQVPNTWYSYYNTKQDLIGFKDSNGKIMVPARFGGITRASVFQNIIAVTDANTNTSYYLLKNGKQVAKDSLYVWDMTYDCEQESNIRFHDQVTDRVGFLSKNGKINIPAIYNDARPFYNGLALVIHDGKRICADGTPYKVGCEHWSWNGITALINTAGTLVADSIDITNTDNMNWYSCKMTDAPADTTLYTSIKANNGKYYTFINYQKEFNSWFYQNFMKNLKGSSLSAYCFNEVIVEGLWKQTLRKRYGKSEFLKQYTAIIQQKMSAIKLRKVETNILSEDLNALIYNTKSFKVYYTDCDEPNPAKFPSFDVITDHYDNKKQLSYQEHFSFLRTAQGYKLIAIALKTR